MFLSQAAANPAPFLHLLDPYGGYLHLVPRLLAAVTVTVAPVNAYPTVLNTLSAVVIAGVAVAVYSLARNQGFGTSAALTVYAMTFLAPTLASEALGNTANLHWFFLWLAPWLFLGCARSRVSASVMATLALAATLTEIQMLLFVPLLFWRPRVHLRWWVLVAAGAGLGAQIATTLSCPRPDRSFEWSPDSVSAIVRGFVAYVGDGIWLSLLPSPSFIASVGWLGLTALVLLPSLLAAIWVIAKEPSNRLLVAALVVGAIAAWTAACVVNNLPAGGPLSDVVNLVPNSDPGYFRHAAAPAWMMAALLPVAADSLIRQPARLGTWTGAALIAALCVGWMMAYPDHTAIRRDSPVTWHQRLSTARKNCAGHPSASVTIEIPPGDGWGVTVSCRMLSR